MLARLAGPNCAAGETRNARSPKIPPPSSGSRRPPPLVEIDRWASAAAPPPLACEAEDRGTLTRRAGSCRHIRDIRAGLAHLCVGGRPLRLPSGAMRCTSSARFDDAQRDPPLLLLEHIGALARLDLHAVLGLAHRERPRIAGHRREDADALRRNVQDDEDGSRQVRRQTAEDLLQWRGCSGRTPDGNDVAAARGTRP